MNRKKVHFVLFFVFSFCLCLGLFIFKPSLPLQAAPPTPTTNQPTTFQSLIADTQPVTGLFTLYRNQQQNKLFLEIKPEQLNKDYLYIASLASGIGEGAIVKGLPLNTFPFRFRRVDNRLHFVIPNLNFRTRPNDRTSNSLRQSFSDSVLYSLPIVTTNPGNNGLVVDLKSLLLSNPDFSALGPNFIPGAQVDANKSYLSESKAFPNNLELEVVYGFSSTGGLDISSLPDSRAFNLAIHYSLSALPDSQGYIPRLADDRIGYFINAYKDLSNPTAKESFVRYIERWRLEPTDPSLPLSPVKKPIVFWIENTVPQEYREIVKEGILLWNKAFEQAGYKDAIQAQQMPDNPSWDPADVRYSVIRWFDNFQSGFLGLGPSHVNPYTGEILDADILINGNVVRLAQEEYRNFSSLNQPLNGYCSEGKGFEQYWGLSKKEWDQKATESTLSQSPFYPLISPALAQSDLCYGAAASEQFSMGDLAMSLLDNAAPSGGKVKEYIKQYLRVLIAHEVGHALGLRHNFHGSTLLQPEELNNTEITHTKGLVASVMDYTGVNLAPKGIEQGDYFPVVIGPYDRWAIEYGYKYSGALVPEAERRFLESIARRSIEPELAYATDEDSSLQNPEVNVFDLSGDVLKYAQWQMDNGRQMWERLQKRYPVQGDSYSDLRVRFDQIFRYYFRQATYTLDYVGGRSFGRDRPGYGERQAPFQTVSLDKQREALQVIQKYVFAEDAFNFSPELLNELAPSRWWHWGVSPLFSLDYPIHDNIFAFQSFVLNSLLSPERLNNLRDIELKTPQEALTLPEIFDTLTGEIWSEVVNARSNGINISSIRRSLQREHLNLLTAMVLRQSPVPEDARTLAWYQLRQLTAPLDQVLKRHSEDLDTYTKAHLEEIRDRLHKTLEAQIQSS